MPISNDDVNTLLGRTQRIEDKQNRLMRTVYGDEEYKGLRTLVHETKARTEAIDEKIAGYEDRLRGAKWVLGGFVFLLSSGALAALINILTGG